MHLPAARERAQSLLRQLLKVLTGSGGEALTSWSERALLRLPRALLDLEETRLLAYGTAFRTGRGELVRGFPAGSEGRLGWLQSATAARVRIGMRLVEGGVELGPTGLENNHEVEVPGLRPLAADLFVLTPGEERRRIELYLGEPRFKPAPGSWATLRFDGGQSFRLERLEQRSEPLRVRVGPASDGSDEPEEAPFVIGIISDLQGDREPLPPGERSVVDVSLSTFDELFEVLRPRLHFGGVTSRGLTGDEVEVMPDQPDLEMRLRHQDEVLGSRRGEFRPANDVEIRSLDDLRPERLTRLAFPSTAMSPGLVDYFIRHPGRRRLEAAWRGLYFLLSHLRSGQNVKLRLLSVSAEELRASDFDALSVLEQALERPYREPQGEPFSLLIVGDEFGSAVDFERLGALARVLERFGVPMLAGLAPRTFGLQHWSGVDPAVGLAERRATIPLELRGSPAARFVCLSAPRILVSRPERTKGAEALVEDPEIVGCDINAAWALAVIVGQAFTRYGWLARIEGCEAGGRLSIHAPEASEQPLTCRFSESDRRLLAAIGVTALMPGRGPDEVNLLDARTLSLTVEREDEDLRLSEGPDARLSIVFNAARFGQSALRMLQDRHFDVASDEFDDWLAGYVHATAEQETSAELAKRPLASGEIELLPGPGSAGRLSVRPAFQYDPRPERAIELRLSAAEPEPAFVA